MVGVVIMMVMTQREGIPCTLLIDWGFDLARGGTSSGVLTRLWSYACLVRSLTSAGRSATWRCG
jgi:hypothetical protein